MKTFRPTTTLVALALALVVSCKGSTESASKPEATATPVPSPAATPSTVPSAAPVPRGKGIPLFSGPPLLILPGQGLGPIRFGATVATIERLMEAPCEFKDEKVCRYVSRAVEIGLDEKGAAKEMRVYRGERPAPNSNDSYGVFRGRAENGLAPLMLQSAVRELYGKPLEVQEIKDGGAANTVEIDTYKGMKLEFDRMPSGSIVVGCIDLTKA